MELQKVSQVAKIFDISTRTLRYYEKIGLIQSIRNEENSYRYYDDTVLKRIQQIVILRKLQIPVKQIAIILDSPDTAIATDIFSENITALQNEITALETIKSALEIFVAKIKEIADVRLNLNILTNDAVMELANTLSLTKKVCSANFSQPAVNTETKGFGRKMQSSFLTHQKNVKEIQTMSNLQQASQALDKLKDKDVRIVYLPPATVASIHFIGSDEEGRIPESQGEDIIASLVKQLAKTKPDCRHYGFNRFVDGEHGYERWFTIPDDMELPSPFVKKQFPGGVYGAYALRTWDNEWDLLIGWANQHEKYDFAQGSPDSMLGLLEEHLNVMGQYALPGVKHETQVDLLIPLREKREWSGDVGYIADSESKCGYKASLIEMDGFTAAGYAHKVTEEAGCEVFYQKITDDGRLKQMKAALKLDAPILIFHYYDLGHTVNVCADMKYAANKKYFESDKVKVNKISKKKWIQFELTMEDMKGHTWDKFQPHDLVGKLGYKFDGSSGFFFVYNSKELIATEENKNEPLYCWMPVIPQN